MKKKLLFKILFLSFLPFFSVRSFSQEKTMITPYIQLQYFKNSDDQRFVQTTLTYSKNRMELPLPGMAIYFNTGVDKKDSFTTVLTDNKGVARLQINKDMNLKTDKDGLWLFSSEFKGNDTIESGKSDITVKDVSLGMSLTEVDSIKTITVSAFIKQNGEEKPVSGEAVKVYVPRMFSLLPLGEVTLDESGTATLEFPSDLPGDSLGILTVIAKFEENQTFGNVEKQSTLKWGVPTKYIEPKFHRALWTKTAPKWMIYTLSVLLAGVWGHYLFAIISLIRIKIEAKKKAKEEYRI